MSSSSDNVSLSSSSSGSVQSRGSVGGHLEEESTSLVAVVGRIPMETVTEVREDPPEEIAESNWPAKADYDWVAADVRNQSSLFWWSRLLNSWLNCTPVIASASVMAKKELPKLFLHVYVPFFSITCEVAAR